MNKITGRINFKKMLKDFMIINTFGAIYKTGGIERLAFSKDDLKARDYLIKVMIALGLTIEIDPIGNIFARRKGLCNDTPPVVLGSHIDSVSNGGKFDGALGVLAAIQIIRTLNENNIATRRPIVVAIFSCEESSGFGVATVGSKCMVGRLAIEDLKRHKNSDGISIFDAAVNAGYNPANLADAYVKPGTFWKYFELHIEQGPILASEGYNIGLVSHIAAAVRYLVTILGEANHSGTTPMYLRKDASLGASEIELGIESICKEAGICGTVGIRKNEPNNMNVIPGKVTLGIDIRSLDLKIRDSVSDKIVALFDAIARKRNLEITHEVSTYDIPVMLSEDVVSSMAQIAEEENIKYKIMPSGAGHDCMWLNEICQSGLIFVPSLNKGISHHPDELSSWNDIYIALKLMFKIVLQSANE